MEPTAEKGEYFGTHSYKRGVFWNTQLKKGRILEHTAEKGEYFGTFLYVVLNTVDLSMEGENVVVNMTLIINR